MAKINSKNTKYSIKLTKQQFLTLLKAVYLGNWLANAQRTKDKVEEYEKMESYIFSHAKQFGYSKYVDDEEAAKGKYYPTGIFETETDVSALREKYNNNIMWEELSDALAWRDAIKKYGQEKLAGMTVLERMIAISKISDKYGKIFHKVGLDAIKVKGAEDNKN